MYQEDPLFSETWNKRTSRVSWLQAVVKVFEQMDDEKAEPRASRWNNPAYLQKHALPRILKEWSRLTGLDDAFFPVSLGEVVSTWEEWRKMNAAQGEKYCQQLGLPDFGHKYRSKVEKREQEAKEKAQSAFA